MMRSKFTPFVLFLAVILFSSVIVQAGVPLEADGTVPGKPFQDAAAERQLLQNQIDAIPEGPVGPPGGDGPPGPPGADGVLLGKGDRTEEQFTDDGDIYSVIEGLIAGEGTLFEIGAACADDNDIAISGLCKGPLFADPPWIPVLTGIFGNTQQSPSNQRCIWNKPNLDTTHAGIVQVDCIKVPGP